MTDDLVKRLREYEWAYTITKEAADRIEALERALLDVAQYTSSVDLCHYVEPETRKVLNEIWENKDDQ